LESLEYFGLRRFLLTFFLLIIICLIFFFFFFSSRRRHTRWPRDWSSDVCSSDLHDSGPMWVANPLSCDFFIHYNLAGLTGAQERSEERRVGKECRSRWWAYH